MFIGSRFQWKIFVAPVRNRIRLRYVTNKPPHHNSGSARHCGLSKSVYWEPTGGRCVFECKCVRI